MPIFASSWVRSRRRPSVCGTQDPVTTVEHGQFMEQRIAGAERVDFDAAHLSNVEAGEVFTRAVLDFLRG